MFNVLLIAVGYIFIRRYVDGRTSQEAHLSEIRQQINQMIQELDETTERNIQIIEHRIEELKGLASQSRKDIELLQTQRNEYSKALENYRRLGRMENPLRSDEKEAFQENLSTEEKDANLDHQETPQSSPRALVSAALQEGLTPSEISAKLDIPQGEVELIIQMQRIRK